MFLDFELFPVKTTAMNTLKYLVLLVFCFVALLLLAKSEPMPADGEDDAYYSYSSEEYEEQNGTATNNICKRQEPCQNGGTCENNNDSYSCTCPDNFSGNDCEVVNQCRYPGSCVPPNDSDHCERCRNGFTKAPEDETSCTYVNSTAFFIFVVPNKYIQLVDLDGKVVRKIVSLEREFDDHHVMSMDYSYETNTLFWASDKTRDIETNAITEGPGGVRFLPYDDPKPPIDNVHVDWVHRHLYFVARSKLVVANFNGSMKKTLLDDFHNIYTIDLDQFRASMYWRIFGENFVEKAGLDGSRRQIIFSPNKTKVWNFAIDFVENRLYWVLETTPSTPESMWSTELDGSDPKVFHAEQSALRFSSFNILTFDQYVYELRLIDNTFYKINICNNEDKTMFYKPPGGADIRMMAIIHAALQPELPEAENVCLKRIDQCSHFCFPDQALDNSRGPVSSKCACPDGKLLSSDNHTCA